MGNHSDDGLDLDRSIFRDSCRTGSGLVVNGAAFRILGRCECGCPLYSEMERTGVCVTCQVRAERGQCKAGVNHEAVKADDAAWSLLKHVGFQHVEAYEDEPAYTLEIRNCACHSSLCRVVP